MRVMDEPQSPPEVNTNGADFKFSCSDVLKNVIKNVIHAPFRLYHRATASQQPQPSQHKTNSNDSKLAPPTPPPEEESNKSKLISPLTPPEDAKALLGLNALYSESAIAKILGVAKKQLNKDEPPTSFPEYTQPNGTTYINSSLDFWTSGFFPGSLYLLYERSLGYPSRYPTPHPSPSPVKLHEICTFFTTNLHSQSTRTDTHDLGFLIQPWAQLGWELDHDVKCYESLVNAANALASRFDERVGCIRSWDTCFTKRYAFGDPKEDFLVIIDNMMNLNLLFYVSKLTSNPHLAEIATIHALTTLRSNIRPDNSTYHVINFDQTTGNIKQRMTNQGYSDTSCWSRGQAWGVAGFAQTYSWTKNPIFLETSKRLADYFLERLPEDGVPYWDFDAPRPGPRDTSAGLVASYGMLLLYREGAGEKYLEKAIWVLKSVVGMSLAPGAKFVSRQKEDGEVEGKVGKEGASVKEVEGNAEDIDWDVDFGEGGQETIVLNATINNYEFAPRRWADHGLVYADYYFLLIGNLLLKMGLVGK